MTDAHSDVKRNDLDGLVYTKLSGTVLIGNRVKKFGFYIKHHYDLIRYRLSVKWEQGLIKVRAVDADYKVKKDIFDAK